MDEIDDSAPERAPAVRRLAVPPAQVGLDEAQEVAWRDVLADPTTQADALRRARELDEAAARQAAEPPPVEAGRHRGWLLLWMVVAGLVVALLWQAFGPWEDDGCERQGGVIVKAERGAGRCVDPAILK